MNICLESEMKSIDYFIVGIASSDGVICCLCLNGELKVIHKKEISNVMDGWKNRPFKLIRVDDSKMIILDSDGKAFQYNLESSKLTRIGREKDYKLILDGDLKEGKTNLYLISEGNKVCIIDNETGKFIKEI